MVTVYVLLSIKDQASYVGMAIDPIKRLHEHNCGKNRYTKGHLPWKIIYSEEHPEDNACKNRFQHYQNT